MGYLQRITRVELEKWDEAEPEWFAEFLGGVGDGSVTPVEYCRQRAWSYGAFMQALRGDGARSAAYEEAKRSRAEMHAFEVVPQADGAEDAALAGVQVKARQWVAGRWDRERYGEKVDVKHSGGVKVELVRFGAVIDGKAEEVVDAVESGADSFI